MEIENGLKLKAISERFADWGFTVLIGITMIAVLVPLSPGMPRAGLDPSWVLGMNEAVTRGLAIGNDIIFTFGPYASVYTRQYHPGTDHLMVGASIVMAIAFTFILRNLGKQYSRVAIIYFLCLLVVLAPRDPLFLAYPLFLALYLFTLDGGIRRLEVLFVLSALGLVPLIKGSFVMMAGVGAMSSAAFYFYRNEKLLAVLTLLCPFLAMLMFWHFSGQPLGDVFGYYSNLLPVVSGYTEALSLEGSVAQVWLFIVAAIVMLMNIFWHARLKNDQKLSALIILASYLFLMFKAGFVRHDGHALMAGQAMLISAVVVHLICRSGHNLPVLGISLFTWAFIDQSYAQTSTKKMLSAVVGTYGDAWSGLKRRLSDRSALRGEYHESLRNIASKDPIKKLPGKTDIFPYDQASLLASGGIWSPRPIFQSYSAYTPLLASINELHFRTSGSPDNVVFRLKPIDRRLPSLDDGLTWPALSDNYVLHDIDKDTVYLKRRRDIKRESQYHVVYEGRLRLGDVVLVPASESPIYAEISIKPTLLGRVMSILYKLPQLTMKLHFENGGKRAFRVIGKMMQSKFLLSPLVDDARSFAFLVSGNDRFIHPGKLKGFILDNDVERSALWQSKYSLKLYEYTKANDDNLLPGMIPEVLDKVPAGLAEPLVKDCDGAIDSVNGASLRSQPVLKAVGALNAYGWVASSVRSGLGPDDIFAIFADSSGKNEYIRTLKSPRDDVKIHFGHPQMVDVGYQFDIDLKDRAGLYAVTMGYSSSGVLYKCRNLSFNLSVGKSNGK